MRCLVMQVQTWKFLQHALSRYVYNRSLFDIFTQVEMTEESECLRFEWVNKLYKGRVRLGIFRNKNVFRNIFRLFCCWEQNSQNGIQVFRNENSSQTNAYLHYSNYSYSGLIPNERALSVRIFSLILANCGHKENIPNTKLPSDYIWQH